MGSHKSLVKRIKRIEQSSTDPVWRVAVYDAVHGVYSLDDGRKLCSEEFSEWQRGIDQDTQVIIVELTCNAAKQAGELQFNVSRCCSCGVAGECQLKVKGE